jgi:hypothetical protein
MVRAVAQIERELAALDQTVVAMAQAFYDAYQQYLTALGKAMRQQFILAGFHICTHAYPEQFLSLSEEQRKELQQSLQRLAKQGQDELLDCLKPVQIMSIQNSATQAEIDDPEDDPEAEGQAEEPQEDASAFDASEPTQSKSHFSEGTAAFDAANQESNFDTPVAPDAPLQLNLDRPEELAIAMSAGLSEEVAILLVTSEAASPESELPTLHEAAGDRPLHPKDIAYWQSQLEEAIVEVLQNLSHTTNCVLQQANILPSRLPEPVLEVAAKADLSSEATASPPNLLNLLIEADGEDEKLSMTQVMAMRLRLSEIEFGDAATAAHRSKLRHLMTQLGKLGREYQRKQKERAVAQAEAAWRSSWSE